MHEVIYEEVFFPGVDAETLFRMYTDQAIHTAVTDHEAFISDRLGAPFRLYNGFCFGENLEIIPNKIVVQSWRTDKWPKGYDDSYVMISFLEKETGTSVHLTHSLVPSKLYKSLKLGWKKYYWLKWKKYLKRRQTQNNTHKFKIRTMEQFLLNFHHFPLPVDVKPSKAEFEAVNKQWQDYIGGIAMQGRLVGTQRLDQSGTVVGPGGQLSEAIREGQGLIVGTLTVKAASLEEAVGFAKDCPVVHMGGSVEVRPILAFDI